MHTFRTIACFILLCLCCQPTNAQQTAKEDFSSLHSIIQALYDVISGPATQPRNWDRFRSLFAKDARMMTAVVNKDSGVILRTITPEQYIERNATRLQQLAFTEKEIHRITEKHGAVIQVFSTYQSSLVVNNVPQTIKGINSIQLFDDGKRLYIVSIFWDSNASLPIDAKYLPQ